jgi:hypothetical protein
MYTGFFYLAGFKDTEELKCAKYFSWNRQKVSSKI